MEEFNNFYFEEISDSDNIFCLQKNFYQTAAAEFE